MASEWGFNFKFYGLQDLQGPTVIYEFATAELVWESPTFDIPSRSGAGSLGTRLAPAPFFKSYHKRQQFVFERVERLVFSVSKGPPRFTLALRTLMRPSAVPP